MKKIIAIISVIIFITACKKNSIPAPVPYLTDIDGNAYDLIKIGTQTWMKQNLKTTRYKNGDLIQNENDPTVWASLTTGVWCYYANVTANGTVYGKLYNWYAVNDPRGLAPAGYHIPSDAEWTTLSTGLGGDLVAGDAMKETGTAHWTTPNTGATNISGFTALPGGGRNGDGTFEHIGNYGFWWSATESNTYFAGTLHLFSGNGFISMVTNFKQLGFSVRCLKD